MSERICVIDGRRRYERAQVCDADRVWLDRTLADIVSLAGRILDVDDAPPVEWSALQQTTARTTPEQEAYLADVALRHGLAAAEELRLRLWRAEPGHDPVSAALPGGPTTVGDGPKVSGSRAPGAPTDLDRVDLSLGAYGRTTRDTMVPATRVATQIVVRRYAGVRFCEELLSDGQWRRVEVPIVREESYLARRRVTVPGVLVPAGDQIGHVPAAARIAWIVDDWRTTGWPDGIQPVGTIPAMVRWLRDRLDWACNHHPGIAVHAEEIRDLHWTLRAALDELPPPPELCHGVACGNCDARSLFKKPPWIECESCGKLYSDDEYDELCRELHASVKGSRR